MGTDPEGRAGGAIGALRWRPTSARRPQDPGSDRVRGDVGLRVAADAEVVVRAIRGDSLPPVRRVDEGPRVGQAAPPGPRRTRVLRRPGLVSLCDRLGEHEGPEKGELTGPNPVDRGKYGSKIHLVTERTGLPLSVGISGANVHDSETLKGIPPIRSPRGPRRGKPSKLHADREDDYSHLRRWLSKRGIRHCIARKGVETSQRPAPLDHRAHDGLARWMPSSPLSLRAQSRVLPRL